MTRFFRTLVMLAVTLTLWTVAGTAQAQDYRIRTGDQLAIEVLEDDSLNRTLAVLPGGTVTFPYVGSLRVSGATPSQVAARISGALAGTLATAPTVFVSVIPRKDEPVKQEPLVVNIYVMGEVSAPGGKTVAPGTTFLQALSQAGGMTPYAATKRVQLRRAATPSRVVVVNYQAIMDGAAMTHDPVLAEGDVIVVPSRRLFE